MPPAGTKISSCPGERVPTSGDPSSILASNPDGSFARPLEGGGPVCGAEKLSKGLPGSARGGPKPSSYEALHDKTMISREILQNSSIFSLHVCQVPPVADLVAVSMRNAKRMTIPCQEKKSGRKILIFHDENPFSKFEIEKVLTKI